MIEGQNIPDKNSEDKYIELKKEESTQHFPENSHAPELSQPVTSNQQPETENMETHAHHKTPDPGSALWSRPLAPHSLKNVGEKDLHVISVEIKKKNSTT